MPPHDTGNATYYINSYFVVQHTLFRLGKHRPKLSENGQFGRNQLTCACCVQLHVRKKPVSWLASGKGALWKPVSNQCVLVGGQSQWREISALTSFVLLRRSVLLIQPAGLNKTIFNGYPKLRIGSEKKKEKHWQPYQCKSVVQQSESHLWVTQSCMLPSPILPHLFLAYHIPSI